jgi:hypothetical protein
MSKQPDFTQINYDDIQFDAVSYEEWKQQVEAKSGMSLDELVWKNQRAD